MRKILKVLGVAAVFFSTLSCALRKVNYCDFSSTAFGPDTTVVDWARTDYFSQIREGLSERPRVIFIGDSITEGWWKSDPEFFAERGFLCFGIGGQTSSQILLRFRTDVIDLHPDKAVILCGINDLAQNGGPVKPTLTLGNIVSMCELAVCNGITPLVCSLTPCDYFAWNPSVENVSAKVRDFNRVLRDFALSRRIGYVDYYSLLDAGDGSLPAEYTVDRCHLTLPAYKIMEREVLKRL